MRVYWEPFLISFKTQQPIEMPPLISPLERRGTGACRARSDLASSVGDQLVAETRLALDGFSSLIYIPVLTSVLSCLRTVVK